MCGKGTGGRGQGAGRSFAAHLVLSLLAGVPSTGQALELEAAQARFVEPDFVVELVAVLDAPVSSVERVLHDYEAYPELDTRIIEASTLARQEGAVVLQTKLRACAGIFCRTVRRVEKVTMSPGELVALVDPTRSEMRHGETRTRLESVGDRTRVRYMTRFAPAFWVPAFLGRPLMLRTLREASIELFANVEARARDDSG